MRLYVGESDRHGNRSLYEAIVLKAREQETAGATVLRHVMGLGRHSVLYTAKILRLSGRRSDGGQYSGQSRKGGGFLSQLDGMIADRLVTLEPIKVLQYKGLWHALVRDKN